MIELTDQELYEKAVEAMNYSYSPYSHYKVGAALLTQSGKVFTGCNIENATYGATICGERTAFVKAISEGHKDIKVIAIAGSDDNVPAFPCGICRQFIFEFGDDIKIVLKNKGVLVTYSISELLPEGFRL